ncbi:MAG: ABC transporter permease DevC [Chroococcales cyanobacterium]
MKIPLAWRQLSYERIRLFVALAGIGFADILMFMQLGFQAALYAGNLRLHNSFNGDIFLISPQSDSLISMHSFSSRRIYQSLGVEGVKSVHPVYLDFALWKNPENQEPRAILVMGFNPVDNILALPNVQQNLDVIKFPDVVLFDQKSRDEFGNIAEDFNSGKTVVTEVADRKIRVGGLFSVGASFAADGNLITSDINFIRLFPRRDSGLIDLGVIKLESNANLETVLSDLKQFLPEDILVFSKEEFIAHEKSYWQNRTAIGFIFSLGTAMGFIVGTVIVYQILYTDVADHLPEYATLKAMGYTETYLLSIVFQEAIILALLGYIPGFSITIFLYFNAARATGLPIVMTLSRAIAVLILTILMCCISGAIAMRKLQDADPADIF